jgi:tetratricopeptide (TPR) repeat protein
MFLLLGAAHKSILSAEPNAVLSNAESEFADLIIAADAELDSNDRAGAEQFLLQGNQILNQNPGINTFLKGHFNKVYGKFYMAYDAAIALQYFNTAISQFSGNALEQAETKMFIGIAHYHAGNYTIATSYFEEAKAIFDSQGDMQKSAQALNNLGVVAFQQGNAETAVILCNRSLSINNEIGNRVNADRNQHNLAVFTGDSASQFYTLPPVNSQERLGGTGTGSGSTITTSGSGTVVVTTPGG